MPGMHTFCPDISGRVIDQKTRLGVSNANIQLTATYGANHLDVKTSSNEKGEFYIKKQSRLILYWFGDPFIYPMRYIIEADGYIKADSYHDKIYHESPPDYSFDFKKPIHIRIELEPIAPNTLPANPG
jgi:hypothetical protein